MNITEFFRQARGLLNDVEEGVVDPTQLSDEGRLALDIAARKVSVNDLTNDGRKALGLEPLPEPTGVVTSPIPFGSKVGQAAIGAAATVANVLDALKIGELGKRTSELQRGALEAVGEIPGQVSRAGRSFRQAAELATQGEWGHAAAELGGGLAETGSALLGLGAPLTIPLAPAAAATGMAAEGLAGMAGLPQKFNVGAAEVTPRGVGELFGLALPGVAAGVAGRTPRTRMPAITDPELAHLRYGLVNERINASQAAKEAVGEGAKARANERAAQIRIAERELAKGTYTSKQDLFKLLYDQTSEGAQDAASRTQYVEPTPAGREANVRPGGEVVLTGRESPMGAAAPGVADVETMQRAENRRLAASVGLDPNQYGGPLVEPAPATTAEPAGVPGRAGAGAPGEAFPGLREFAPESFEEKALGSIRGKQPFEEGRSFTTDQMNEFFPGSYAALEEPGKGAPKGKTKKGPKSKRSQVVQIIKEANPEMSTSAAAKVARVTVEAAERVAEAELPPAPRRAGLGKIEPERVAVSASRVQELVDSGMNPNEARQQAATEARARASAEIVEDAKAAVDNVVLDDATARIEAQPPIEEASRPVPEPKADAPQSTIVANAPPVESAAPVPAQTRVTKPAGRETALRPSTVARLKKAGFEDDQIARLGQLYTSGDPTVRAGLAKILERMRKQGTTALDFQERTRADGGIEMVSEKAIMKELAGQVSVGESGGGAEVPLEGEFWRPPPGVAQAKAPTVRRPTAATLPEMTRLTYRTANDILKPRGRKLVISTEADPGKPAEPVFLLQKLSGEPVLDETTGRAISYRTPEDAVNAATYEGPGAMAIQTPAGAAQVGLMTDPKSANQMVMKTLAAGGVEHPGLGVFTSEIRVNTPGFTTRYDPNAHLIFSHAVDTDIRVIKFVNSVRRRTREISKQLANAKEENDLFLMGKVREMKPEQARAFLADVSPNVKRLWELHKKLMDEVYEQVKRSDPSVKYRQDYISQFPLDAAIEQYFTDLQHANDMAKHFPNEPRYAEQAKRYTELLQAITQQRNAIENMRYERQPDGSYFGPLNEARMLNLDYQRSYVGVLERYLDGVERKLFLDRTLPVFKRYIKSDSLANKPEMRLYLHDWMNNLRGMYGRRWRMALENNFKALGVDNPFEARRLAADLSSMENIVNGFQAIVYMGLRAKSIINNTFQTLMTTYPEIGARSYAQGLSHVFSRRAWEFARQQGLIDFVPDNLGELYREASDALRTRNFTKIINATVTGGVRYAMRPFQLIEMGNNVISNWGGYHYARNVLQLDAFKAADYAKALALRANYIMRPVNTPMRFTGPLGRMGGFLQRFKVNYAEQLVTNAERFAKGDRAPFIRQLGVYIALTGTEGLVLYNLAADQAMKRFGVNLPRFNPLQWATMQAGLPHVGDFFENMAPSLALFTNIGPGTGGDITNVIKPVPVQTVQNLWQQGPAALVPSSVRDVIRSAVELGRGSAQSTRTGKTIAQRSPTDVLMSSVGLQPWAEGLRNRYLRQISTAFEGGRHDVATRLLAEARQKGLKISGNEFQAIRQSVRQRSRGSSTAGQFTQQILQQLGIK